MDIFSVKKAHFIGIGGIGVSGLAKIFYNIGILVSGSDAEESKLTKELLKMGVNVKIGHAQENLEDDVELVVHTSAIPKNNPESVKAKEKNILVLSYSEALGLLTKKFKTIAISGTHGKSTTTSMLGKILIEAGLDPLVLVGTEVEGFSNGNVHLGKGEWFVVEACEHNAQMLNLFPEKIIITNIEPDHLDFYGTLEKLKETFSEYIKKVSPENLVANFEDKNVKEIMPNQAISFGINNGTARILKRKTENGKQKAEIISSDGNKYEIVLNIPGEFNMMNALGAFEMARLVGVSADVAIKALADFKGSWRRFEIIGEKDGVKIISDYGHHPTAIIETIKATREFFPDKKVFLVYQPHQHHRTKSMFNDFAKALSQADKLLLCEIYDVKGRVNEEDKDVSSKKLLDIIEKDSNKEYLYASNIMEAEKLLKTNIKQGDIVLLMGAGDIFKILDTLWQ